MMERTIKLVVGDGCVILHYWSDDRIDFNTCDGEQIALTPAQLVELGYELVRLGGGKL